MAGVASASLSPGGTGEWLFKVRIWDTPVGFSSELALQAKAHSPLKDVCFICIPQKLGFSCTFGCL